MNSSIIVHYAIACLEGLESPATPQEISRTQHVPLEDCLFILRRFKTAGIVRHTAEGLVERTRAIDELTALEVLQALWSRKKKSVIRMLYGGKKLEVAGLTRKIVPVAAWPIG